MYDTSDESFVQSRIEFALFEPIWSLLQAKKAILKFQLLNKLAPWWPKRKNKTTFIIKIPPIYINKVALFSSFDPF